MVISGTNKTPAIEGSIHFAQYIIEYEAPSICKEKVDSHHAVRSSLYVERKQTECQDLCRFGNFVGVRTEFCDIVITSE